MTKTAKIASIALAFSLLPAVALAKTVTGVVGEVLGESITLSPKNSSSTVYSVDANGAKARLRYGAGMNVSQIQNGDNLQVSGTASGTNFSAKTIRDLSQQQYNGSFSGSVTSVNGTSFVLQTKERGSQTVNTASSTVFKENGQTSASINNVTPGESVEVSGLWDSANSNITATRVTIVVKSGTWDGILQAVSGDTLTVTAKNSSSTVYSVDVTNAKLIRRYGASMQLSDYQAGDLLAIIGTLNMGSITAKTVRDESLQAHNGTFVGTVTAITGGSFTLQSKNRGPQSINTTSSTIFRLGTASSSISSLTVGQTVTVSGVWDRTNSNVTATRVSIKVSSITFSGALSAINGDSLTVTTASSTVYTVDATKAEILYKGGRRASLSTLQLNDQVTVRGQAVSGSTNVTASSVRDLSQTKAASPAPSPTPTPTPTPTPSPTATPTPTPT